MTELKFVEGIQLFVYGFQFACHHKMSAYASGYLTKEYKRRGGKYKTVKGKKK
mgnify:CR=1 FL=1